MDFIYLILKIPAILIATTIHEFVRALTSTILGDQKPKKDKRLTLNPLKHFEPIGFFIAFATGCGWGKPVDTSALYYKNRKLGILITAIVPSVINIIIAVVFAVIYKMFFGFNIYLNSFFYYTIYHNIALAVYNIMPVSPLDGQKVLSCILKPNNYFKYLQYEKIVQIIFLLLLFMGYTDMVFDPIIDGIITLIDIILL